MSVLTGPEIARIVKRTAGFKEHGFVGVLPRIEIEPFDERLCGPNSYDVHLAPQMLMYSIAAVADMDVRRDNEMVPFAIPDAGRRLYPGCLYLGSTVERMKCEGVVPWIDGRSSIGRLGVSIHVTAGRGDDGWGGTWTLEITVVHPIRIYPNTRIGQVTFLTLEGERAPYRGKYNGQVGPTTSRLHLDPDNKGTP